MSLASHRLGDGRGQSEAVVEGALYTRWLRQLRVQARACIRFLAAASRAARAQPPSMSGPHGLLFLGSWGCQNVDQVMTVHCISPPNRASPSIYKVAGIVEIVELSR